MTALTVGLRGRLADTDEDRAAATVALASFLADVRLYESQGSMLPQQDAVLVAGAGLVYGDLLARAGRDDQAREAWQTAGNRIRPIADRMIPAAMTQLGLIDLRLGSSQDARAWAEKVGRTTYRHPAFADLQQRLGPTQQAGDAIRP